MSTIKYISNDVLYNINNLTISDSDKSDLKTDLETYFASLVNENRKENM
ncbi:hypothetical protein ACFFIX_19615 [Metabacillus herbersteinensis]|uniref:Uncharacterized protein n=1 Tax=Metabacillus herbersteinensis TaxID=283816 RepID=A0ABV6GIU0_9BACI